jgi:Dolichyl-phosphate-mannose-protein mannosyltransferase
VKTGTHERADKSVGGMEPPHDSLHVAMKVREEPTVRTEASSSPRESWVVRSLVLAVVFGIAAIYVGSHIANGWVPADDGILGQSALRVMQGQLPQRDFAEIYTGGLSVMHALAFRLFGVNLMSMRLSVFLFFLAWIPAVYYIALRFTSAVPSGLITLLAVAWSYPNYPAAMPSWYNLFFATFGAAALLRYLDTRRMQWLFLAGVCGGVSILIKIIGAYYVAGVLLFLAFLEQSDLQNAHLDDSREQDTAKAVDRATLYRVFSASALFLFLATVIYVIRARMGEGEFYHFVLPAAVLVGMILLRERNLPEAPTTERFAGLLRLVTPFVAGALTPIILFLVPYAKSRTLFHFLSGVTSSAIARTAGLGVIRPAGFEKAIFALGLAGLVAAAIYWHEFQGKAIGATAGVALTVLLVKAATSSEIVSGVWYSVATLTPLAVLLGSALIWRAGKVSSLSELSQQRLMLLISLAAICSLVQFPFAAPIYFCYAAPLTLLAAVAVVSSARKHSGTYVLSGIVLFYLLFGVFRLIPDHVYELTHQVGKTEELHLERAGGLRIEYAADFGELIHLLQQHSPNGLMFAGNDCPELYFLSGLTNVTRDDGNNSNEEILQALQSDDLKLVVINEAPFFPTARIAPEVRAELARKFPESQMMGIFHVFWRP